MAVTTGIAAVKTKAEIERQRHRAYGRDNDSENSEED